MISGYSVVTAVFWLSLGMLIAVFLRKKISVFLQYSTTILVWIAALALLRVLLPLDIEYAYIIRSYEIYPAIKDGLAKSVVGSLTLGEVLIAIWMLGSVLILLREVWQEIYSEMVVRKWSVIETDQVERVCEELGLASTQVLLVTELVSPMTVGWMRPKIYVPDLLYTDDQLRWILRHEIIHMVRRDNWLKLFYVALRVLFWWNPVAHWFYQELDFMLEMRCDQIVLAACNQEAREDYARTLDFVYEQLKSTSPLSYVRASTFAKPTTDKRLEERKALIRQAPKDYTRSTTVLVVLCIVVFVGSFFVTLQPAGHPTVQDEMAFLVSPENSYILHTDEDTYELWSGGYCFGTYSLEQVKYPPLCDLKIVKESES